MRSSQIIHDPGSSSFHYFRIDLEEEIKGENTDEEEATEEIPENGIKGEERNLKMISTMRLQ